MTSIADDTIDTLCHAITTQSHDMLCMNDGQYPVDFDALRQRLAAAFETILPEKSSFEK